MPILTGVPGVIGECLLSKGKQSGPLLASEGPSWGSGLGSLENAWANDLAESVANSLWGQDFGVGQGC